MKPLNRILLIVALSMLLQACHAVRYPTAREVYGEPQGLYPGHTYIPLGSPLSPYGSYGSTLITSHPSVIILK